jgi:hypothetical protein
MKQIIIGFGILGTIYVLGQGLSAMAYDKVALSKATGETLCRYSGDMLTCSDIGVYCQNVGGGMVCKKGL